MIYEDESFELKSKKDGYTIKSYLVKYIDDVEVERTLLRSDKYLPQRRVIVYGVRKRECDTLNSGNVFDEILQVDAEG